MGLGNGYPLTKQVLTQLSNNLGVVACPSGIMPWLNPSHLPSFGMLGWFAELLAHPVSIATTIAIPVMLIVLGILFSIFI